ncbi:MAG TPA: peptidylprolyl isomerase [Candidatus Hydrogenedentes bacterium]|mgnify:FL=1|nr:peptidylprolyl isomerase [Candidatus Hydrogenedentota bacterium]
MRKINYGWIIAASIALGIGALIYFGSPSRLPVEEQQAREDAVGRLKKVQAEENTLQEKETVSEAAAAPAATKEEKAMWPEVSPDTFKVKFECSTGDFTVECQKAWAPLGVQRFYELVREGFYDNSAFFRVVPGFVVQFGLAADPKDTAKWRTKRLQDDPVKESNLPGYLTFATSGPNSRTTQLFINTGSNKNLDRMGFAPFGKVIEGMDVVEGINAEYGERPNQGMITQEGNAYLLKNFPNITLIKKATLLK